MSRPQPYLMMNALQGSLDRLRKTNPIHFATAAPYRLLVLAAYNTGALHATSEIATGNPSPDLPTSDLDYICELLTSYIQIEQLKLRRNPPSASPMGGDRSPDTTPTRPRVDYTGPIDPDDWAIPTAPTPSEDPGDPEPFDEFTGPTGGAQ